MDIEKIIVGFVGLMLLSIIMIAVVIPTTQEGISGSNQAGTVSNEEFTGVNNTPSTLTKYVAEVISFQKGTSAVVNNTTALVGANGSRIVYLTNPSTTTNRTLTILSAVTGDNVSVYLNGVFLGKMSSTPESWTGLGTTLVNGANTVAFINNNGTTWNITSLNITYNSFTTSTAYSLASGLITPTGGNATYRTSYYYATDATNNTANLLGVIPVLLAVVLVLIVLGFWKMAG